MKKKYSPCQREQLVNQPHLFTKISIALILIRREIIVEEVLRDTKKVMIWGLWQIARQIKEDMILSHRYSKMAQKCTLK